MGESHNKGVAAESGGVRVGCEWQKPPTEGGEAWRGLVDREGNRGTFGTYPMTAGFDSVDRFGSRMCAAMPARSPPIRVKAASDRDERHPPQQPFHVHDLVARSRTEHRRSVRTDIPQGRWYVSIGVGAPIVLFPIGGRLCDTIDAPCVIIGCATVGTFGTNT